MDFGLSEQQEMLKKTARDFFKTELPKTLVKELAKEPKGYQPEMWKKMADLGWVGLVLAGAVRRVGRQFPGSGDPDGGDGAGLCPGAVPVHSRSGGADCPGAGHRGAEEGHPAEGGEGRSSS